MVRDRIYGTKSEERPVESISTRFKKYFGFGDYEGKDTWLAKNWWVLLSLAGIFLLGLLLRSYFYYPMASELGFSGNDPYYHERVIEHIQQHHTHLIKEPMLNYPVGGVNPRPPFFDWSVAVFGIFFSPLFGFNVAESTKHLMYMAPAFWGALTVVPVYLVGKEMFGKKAGLTGAFLMATMGSHIERSPAGFSDHDSIVVFFVVLAIYFLFRSFGSLNHKNWVDNWGSSNSIYRGMGDFFSQNQVPIIYSLLAGVSLSAIALTWKGFPYALAIVFIYFLIQVGLDRFRNVDSTGIFICTFLTFSTTLALSFPYYNILSFTTWMTPFYILLSITIIGSFLIVTQKQPWIIVIPLGAIIGVVGYLLLSLIAPSVAEALVTGQGYFIKSKLYTTIAEAQPPDFSRLAVAYAICVFFFAIIGIIRAAIQIPKHWKKENIFIVVWACVAVFMAMKAVRFMFNATPVITITGGWIMYELIKKINVRSKIMLYYIVTIIFSLILASWWGMENGFMIAYPWLIFVGFFAMLMGPILVAIYDNYDKKTAMTYISVLLILWTIVGTIMLIMDEELRWSTFGNVFVNNLNIWYLGMAALILTIVPIVIFFSKKSFAISHLISMGAISLIMVGLRDVTWFNYLISSHIAKILMGYSLIPILILIFNLYLLFTDKKYLKATARKVFVVALEFWFLSLFFDPNLYAGLACVVLLLITIYLLTPYRQSFKHKTKPMHVIITLFLAFFVLVPQMWFALDASLPYEKKGEMNENMYDSIPDFLEAEDTNNKYFGAFGHGFTSEYWRNAFDWLSKQDGDLSPEDRPGFVSWWDYGFWCTYLGQHPTAADNFQYGYQFAGSFISSQNESEAISLMIGRLLEAEHKANRKHSDCQDILTNEKYFGNEKIFSSIIDGKTMDAGEKIWEILTYPEKYVETVKDNPEKYGKYLSLLPGNAKYAAIRGVFLQWDEQELVNLLTDLETETGKNIRYFAVDSRLFPFSAENTGIFYAPIKLADKDVGDFLEYMVDTEEGEMTMDEVEERIKNDPEFRSKVKDYKLKYTDQFYNSMFYRCYIGYSGEDLGEGDLGVPAIGPSGAFASSSNNFYPMQGWNMSHFRLVYKTMYYSAEDGSNASFPDDYTAMNFAEAQELYSEDGGHRISGLRSGAFFLEYYPGARMSGKVITEGDEEVPMPGVRVVAYDEYGIPHDMCITDDEGNYELILPPGQVNILASSGGYESGDNQLQAKLMMREQNILNQTFLTISKNQSNRDGDNWDIEKNLYIKKSSVDGMVFLDLFENGEYDEFWDEIVDEANVKISSTDIEGISYNTNIVDEKFNFTTVLPGEYTYEIDYSGHTFKLDEKVKVSPNEEEIFNTFTKNLCISLGNISGNITTQEGIGAPNITINLHDRTGNVHTSTLSNESGHYYFDGLLPGEYELTLNTIPYNSISFTDELALGQHIYHNLTLVEVSPVMGTIYFDKLGNGFDPEDVISNARIKFIPRFMVMNSTIAVSNEEGRYQANLSHENYTIFVDYVMGGKHYTYLEEMVCAPGEIIEKNIELSFSFKLEGTITIDDNIPLEEEVKENIGAPVIFIRRGTTILERPINFTEHFSTYLPVGNYYAFAPVMGPNNFSAMAQAHIEGGENENIDVVLVAKTAHTIGGCIFWDKNGDMQLTMGNESLDIEDEVMRIMGAGSESTEIGGEADITRSSEGEDDYTFDNNETSPSEEPIFENISGAVVLFQSGDMEYRVEVYHDGFFVQLLPEGEWSVSITAPTIEEYKATINVVGDNFSYAPEIEPRKVECSIQIGIDADGSGIIEKGEALEDYDILFQGISSGTYDVAYNHSKGDFANIFLNPGNYHVVYHREFMELNSDIIYHMDSNIVLDQKDGVVELNFLVNESIRFRGNTITDTGIVPANLTIELDHIDSMFTTTLHCDEEGNFDMFVPEGSYFLKSRYEEENDTYMLRNKMDISVGTGKTELTLEKAYIFNLTVYFDKIYDGIYDLDDQKLSDVSVYISGDITSTHRTDYRGFVSTALLPHREYIIDIDHYDADGIHHYGANDTFLMPSGPLDRVLAVEKNIRINGKVYWDSDENGIFTSDEKIVGGTVMVESQNGDDEFIFTTDGEGEWAGWVPVYNNNSQQYNLSFDAEGFVGTSTSKTISQTNIDFSTKLLPVSVTYHGKLFLDDNGDGQKNGDETAIPNQEISFWPTLKGYDEIIVKTGKEGAFELELIPGEYTISSLIKGDDVYICEFEENVDLNTDKQFNISMVRGMYVYGGIKYFDTDGNEHKRINAKEDGLVIEGKDSDISRDITFANGYYETYLPLGDYSFDVGEYSTWEYGMEMTYRYPKKTITVDEDFEPLDLILTKKEDDTLKFQITSVPEGEQFNMTVNQGSSVELDILVENLGNIPQNITISAKDLPDNWALDIDSRDANLHIGESVAIHVVVHTSTEAYHQNTVTIEASSSAGSKETIKMDINTHPKYSCEISSDDKLERGFSQNGSRSFNITIKNTGNVGDVLTFYLKEDAPELWDITIQGEELNTSGYRYRYTQQEIYKNLTIKVQAPNATTGVGIFEIGVRGESIGEQSLNIVGTLSKPDISITDVSFKNQDLSDSEKNVTMYVTLHVANCDVGKFNFSVYLDDEKIESLSETIDGIEQDTDYELVFDWNLSDEIGNHVLKLSVDEDNHVAEIDDLINNVWKNENFRIGSDSSSFNWRIVIAVVVVFAIIVVWSIIWKKKQIV